MQNDDALNEISKAAEPSEASLSQTSIKNIWLQFIARALFSYLPISVYMIINIPYFKMPAQDDQDFLKVYF